jgi:EAL domain-containing protein (putative c-di-GMP-specific phosphodiesterase class I)/CheY-like chemotaxis protein
MVQSGSASSVAPARPTSKGCLLVVDDEPEVRRALARVLKHAGFEVETCHDGRNAMLLLASRQFDTIITDISMPDMSGVDLIRHVRERNDDLPVVIVTGGPAVETAIQAIEFGVYRYLVKPVEPAQIINVAEKAVLLYRMAKIRRDMTRVVGGDDRAKLEAALDNALSTMWMAYQPIVRVDGSLFGYEALLRSHEPALGNPGAVLHAAEQLDRLPHVGRAVRERACASFSTAPEPVVLFVNLHTRDLLDESLTSPESRLSQIAGRVILEITERASLAEVRDVRSRVAELRTLGFRIAIDDLGAGYAGLGSFALLEPEVVKIDMALVRDVDKQPMKRKLIGSLASFCKDMGMLVVGEGVETREERDTLIEVGCVLLQGYLIGKPVDGLSQPEW